MIIPTLLPIRSNRGLIRRNGMEDIFEKLFDDFNLERWRETEDRMSAFVPKIDVTENDDTIIITAELAGMRREDVDVIVKGDYLTIRGHKKEEKEEREGEKVRYTERTYGEFERIVPLQGKIDSDKVDASMDNGVLTLIIPKVIEDSKRERKISIRKS